MTVGFTAMAVLLLLLPAAEIVSAVEAGVVTAVAPATFSAAGKHPSKVEVITEV